MEYPFNGILLSDTKELTINTNNDMDRSQNVPNKRSQTRNKYILCDSLYIKLLKMQTNL